MTTDVVMTENISEEARRLLRNIALKNLVVDEDGFCIGLITVKIWKSSKSSKHQRSSRKIESSDYWCR